MSKTKLSDDFIESLVTQIDSSDSLAHYGVKGMKWGIRKDDRKAFINKYKERFAEEYKQEKKAKIRRRVKIGVTIGGTISAIIGGGIFLNSGNIKGAAVSAAIAAKDLSILKRQLQNKDPNANQTSKTLDWLLEQGDALSEGLESKATIKLKDAAKEQVARSISQVNELYSDEEFNKLDEQGLKDYYENILDFVREDLDDVASWTGEGYSPNSRYYLEFVVPSKSVNKFTEKGERLQSIDDLPLVVQVHAEDKADVLHADSPNKTLAYGLVKYDKNLRIVGMTFFGDGSSLENITLEQSAIIGVDDFLAHHGVKGMKWGIRKDRRSKKSSSKKTTSTEESEEKTAKVDTSTRSGQKSVVRNRRSLSDTELKEIIERLKKEKELKDLVRNDNVITAALKEIGIDVFKNTSKKVGTAAATYAIVASLEKSFDRKKAAQYLSTAFIGKKK